MQSRAGYEIEFVFLEDDDSTEALNIEQGCFGTLIVPEESDLIGKELQFVAVSQHTPARFAEVELFSTPITLAAGANPLTSDQIREAGACSKIRLAIDSAVDEDSSLVLLWKA